MVKVVKNLIKIGKKPVVVLPLQDWEKNKGIHRRIRRKGKIPKSIKGK